MFCWYEKYLKKIHFILLAPNLSFWSSIPTDSIPHLPDHHHSNIILNETKYYITFMTNEGDTPKILAALFAGAWLNPKRG